MPPEEYSAPIGSALSYTVWQCVPLCMKFTFLLRHLRKNTMLRPQKHRMLSCIVVNAAGVGPALQVSSLCSAFVTSAILREKLTRTFWKNLHICLFSRSVKLTKSPVVIFRFPRERFAFDCVPAFLLPKLASYSSFSSGIIGKGCHCPVNFFYTRK